MNFIKNINNCKKLSNDKIKILADKLNINLKDKINKNNKNKICNKINNIADNINPCGISLYKESDITLKKHQLSVSNQLTYSRGVIAVHSVGTGKTLTAIASSQCLLKKNIVEHIIVITPKSLQKNFIDQAIKYGLSKNQINNYYTFYTMQGIVNAIENLNIMNPSGCLIIIDEVHNLRTIEGSRFESIFKYTKKAEKILLLTATPLINYSSDIINLISLVNGQKPINIEIFEKIITDKIE